MGIVGAKEKTDPFRSRSGHRWAAVGSTVKRIARRTLMRPSAAEQIGHRPWRLGDVDSAITLRLGTPSNPEIYLVKVIHDSWVIEARGSRTEESWRISILDLPHLLDLLMRDK